MLPLIGPLVFVTFRPLTAFRAALSLTLLQAATLTLPRSSAKAPLEEVSAEPASYPCFLSRDGTSHRHADE